MIKSLEDNGREVLLISMEQMARFAGNMLELDSIAGEKLMAMSARAEACLTADQ